MILSHIQKATIDFMWAFYRENDQLPSGGEISRHFGWKSRTAAADILKILERKMFIERNTVGAYRFTKLFHAEQDVA